jgi:hypothetical protein
LLFPSNFAILAVLLPSMARKAPKVSSASSGSNQRIGIQLSPSTEQM